MSLSHFTQNIRKPYLDGRLENLTVDGVFNPTGLEDNEGPTHKVLAYNETTQKVVLQNASSTPFTIENIGTGVEFLVADFDNTAELRTLTSQDGSIVTTQDATHIDIVINNNFITLDTDGTGISIISDNSVYPAFKNVSLVAGSNITITRNIDGDEVEIAASGGTPVSRDAVIVPDQEGDLYEALNNYNTTYLKGDFYTLAAYLTSSGNNYRIAGDPSQGTIINGNSMQFGSASNVSIFAVGTCTVTNASDIVNFAGVSLFGLGAQGNFVINGVWYQIQQILSDTQLRLEVAYYGKDITTSDYFISVATFGCQLSNFTLESASNLLLLALKDTVVEDIRIGGIDQNGVDKITVTYCDHLVFKNCNFTTFQWYNCILNISYSSVLFINCVFSSIDNELDTKPVIRVGPGCVLRFEGCLFNVQYGLTYYGVSTFYRSVSFNNCRFNNCLRVITCGVGNSDTIQVIGCDIRNLSDNFMNLSGVGDVTVSGCHFGEVSTVAPLMLSLSSGSNITVSDNTFDSLGSLGSFTNSDCVVSGNKAVGVVPISFDFIGCVVTCCNNVLKSFTDGINILNCVDSVFNSNVSSFYVDTVTDSIFNGNRSAVLEYLNNTSLIITSNIVDSLVDGGSNTSITLANNI